MLARSTFSHSVNYRSVTAFGIPRLVTDDEEKRERLAALVERMSPGRSAQARGPNRRELAATLVLGLTLDEASAKVRVGGPGDGDSDAEVAVWTGVVPVHTTLGAPAADGLAAVPLPASALRPVWAGPAAPA